MKNFKKLFAIIFTIAVVVFGVLVMINERELFQSLKEIKWDEELDRGLGIIAIIMIVVDIFLIAPFNLYIYKLIKYLGLRNKVLTLSFLAFFSE